MLLSPDWRQFFHFYFQVRRLSTHFVSIDEIYYAQNELEMIETSSFDLFYGDFHEIN